MHIKKGCKRIREVLTLDALIAFFGNLILLRASEFSEACSAELSYLTSHKPELDAGNLIAYWGKVSRHMLA